MLSVMKTVEQDASTTDVNREPEDDPDVCRQQPHGHDPGSLKPEQCERQGRQEPTTVQIYDRGHGLSLVLAGEMPPQLGASGSQSSSGGGEEPWTLQH